MFVSLLVEDAVIKPKLAGGPDTDQHAVLKQPAGTLSYMSPEQASMAVPDIRHRPLPEAYRPALCFSDRATLRCGQQAETAQAVAVGSGSSGGNHGGCRRKLTAANTALQEELTRAERAKTAALQALRKEIEHSKIDQHLDTLNKWQYRWPDLSIRMTNVSRFIYNYVDGLELTAQERDQVRQAMLDVWQQWSAKVMTRANSIRSKVYHIAPDTVINQNSPPPADL